MFNHADVPRKKAYSYVRMSTDLQLKGDSLRRQREVSRRYAEKHNLALVEDFDLHDIGVSAYKGKNLAFGAFGRFLEAVRQGRIEKGSYLLVESFDRISRQEPMAALKPFMEIVESGLVLVTLDDEREFSGKITFEDLIISIAKMSRANDESARKSDRLAHAWKAKRAVASEKKLTAKCPKWLQLKADRSGFDIIEERAAIVRRIFIEAAAGIGTFKIVKRLNDAGILTFTGKTGWQNSTVNKILSSSAAIGSFQPNRMDGNRRIPEGDPIRNYFPRVVPQATFEAAQRGRLERTTTPEHGKKGSGGAKGKYFTNLFSKLAVCDACGEVMRYENKGNPPKGRTYLVCSNALRKKGCENTGRWRYDYFETAFLTFVEQLDLASLVSSEEQSSKRSELAFELDANGGKAKMLEADLKLAFEASKKLGDSGSEFLASAVERIEKELTVARARDKQIRQEMAVLAETALTYYRKPDQVARLVERVRSARGGDVYGLRAKIASQLQLLIKELRLTIEENVQHFEIVFRDGSGMMLFVDPKDPTKFVQRVSGKEPNFEMTYADGTLIDMPAHEDAVDGR